ncbi:MAG TPA: DHA2 family efflux MFS transporter permease subunit [Candidatus Binataceae bacterium]|nr:DHA2 family efflux MFS transporter permease subunit [Candidatus Binataceae bacterium]
MATAPKITSPPPEHARAESHKWLVALAVMLGATLEVLDTSIVNVALPHMQGSFSASVDEITWVLTSYLVANGVMIPLTGWISARYGRKRYFMASVIVFIFASGLCGAAQTLTQMVIFRLMQGAAGAAMIPSSQAILMETFPPAEQGLAMAMWGVGLMAAPVLGPTLGGWITDNWNWRWNFYINLPIGTIAAVMVYWFVHDPAYLRARRGVSRQIDYVGIACLFFGLGLLQIVLDRGQRSDWFSTGWVCYFTAGSIAAIAILIWHELRFPDPILDLTILKIPVFNISVITVMAMVMILYGTNLLNPLFLQDLMGYDAWRAGLAVAPRGVGTLVTMLFVGQMSRRGFDMRPLVGVGFAIVAYATWMMGHWDLDVGTYALAIPIILSGAGSGFIFPTLSATTLSCVEKERMGYASSLYNMMRNTGSAIGISLVTNLLNSLEQKHQSYLVDHVSIFDVWRLSEQGSRMPGAPTFNYAQELATNQRQGIGMLYHTVQSQASLLAYNDIYRLLAILGALFIPSFLMLKKTTGRAPAGH